jgi:YfiH family protein
VAAHVFTAGDWPLGEAAAAGSDAAWGAVADAVGADRNALWRARQVHGAAVTFGGREPAETLPAADVIVVQEPGHAAGVQMADCVPLLMVDRATCNVAAAHAGWRGLAARAPQVAVETMVQRCGARATDLLVALGPSIGPCCYEVGRDVRRSFDEAGFSAEQVALWFHESPVASARNASLPGVRRRDERWFFDTWAAAFDQVVAAGVPAAQVFVCGLCTASHPGVFCSYRRDGRAAGRLAAAIRCGRPPP